MDVPAMSPAGSLALWNALFVGLGLVAALLRRGRFEWRWFALGLALFNLNVALVLDFTGLAGGLHSLAGSPESQFNWFGKLCALGFSLVLLATPLIDRRCAGVTLARGSAWRLGWVGFAALMAIDVAIALAIETPPFGADAVAYQLTMLSLEEELFYRGILLYCMVRAFGEGPKWFGAHFGWAAAIPTVIFGAIHSLFWTESGLFFSIEIFAITGLMGVFLMWLRLTTGSILAPILLHSGINTVWRVV